MIFLKNCVYREYNTPNAKYNPKFTTITKYKLYFVKIIF